MAKLILMGVKRTSTANSMKSRYGMNKEPAPPQLPATADRTGGKCAVQRVLIFSGGQGDSSLGNMESEPPKLELEVEKWGECEPSNMLAEWGNRGHSPLGQEELDRHMERNRNRRDLEAPGARELLFHWSLTVIFKFLQGHYSWFKGASVLYK